ncbi:MAG: ABC transporter substrate-binding protein [Candidatus Thorarchaeota archaeon]
MSANNTKIIAVVAVIAIIAVASVAVVYFLGPPEGTREPIRIGILEPLTGSVAEPGRGSLVAFQVAAQQLNEMGGILGRPVALYIEDTEGNPEKAASAATKLITVDNVDFLLGTILSGVVMQVAEVAADYETLFVSTNPTTNEFTQLVLDDYARYKYLFRTQWNVTQWTYAWFEGVTSLWPDVESMLFFSEDLLWAHEGSDLLGNYCADAGITYYDVLFTPGITEFSAEIAQVESYAPDVILSSLLFASSIGFQKQWWTAKPDILYFGAGGLISYPSTVAELGANNTDYMVTYNSCWNVSVTEKSVSYFNSFVQFYGEKPFGADVTAYDGLMILAEAIESAGTIDTDAVIAELETGEFTGARGVYQFTRSHTADYMPGVMLQWMNTEAKVIWPTELATGTYQQAPWNTGP